MFCTIIVDVSALNPFFLELNRIKSEADNDHDSNVVIMRVIWRYRNPRNGKGINIVRSCTPVA